LALLKLADKKSLYSEDEPADEIKDDIPEFTDNRKDQMSNETVIDNKTSGVGLHYNIQIHLPATKDLEVYNAKFKSLKDHLID
jgi:hypothetical protein